ncbi:MAG: NAD(P)/FAD-dependent oxidoreductase [Clostridiales bacterium]|nr:NAD(P)/FAD-dependent oxidoreductase [Clostridiales bacterium]
MEKFDVAIIGAGPSGIFSAYELSNLQPDVSIVLLEEGKKIQNRTCPIIDKKVDHCVNCKPCSIMHGFGGAGAFSDGKFNFTTKFGGWLNEFLSDKKIMELIEYVDSINVSFGATKKRYSTENDAALLLEKKALENDLHLLKAQVKHLGTEHNLEILTKQFEYIKEKIDLRCNTHVENIEKTDDGFIISINGKKAIKSKYLIVAPGRSGAEWFKEKCLNLNLGMINNQVDIGVRIELPARVFEHITNAVYEAKLLYRTKQYGDIVRTFCMNPFGHVVAENVDGIVTVNGHSYSDEKLRSKNTNFALLVSNRFTYPFDQPYQYGKRIASLSNMLGGGVLVQRFGDLIHGRRTTEHRMEQSFMTPTFSATPGDLSLVLTKRHLDNIIEMIYALDKIAPGTANMDTLLYGVEVKFYSSRLKLSEKFETEIENMFAIGDGAGITRGLSQASASGIHVARVISDRL